eukprot:2878627-Amphidinium_carterae.1
MIDSNGNDDNDDDDNDDNDHDGDDDNNNDDDDDDATDITTSELPQAFLRCIVHSHAHKPSKLCALVVGFFEKPSLQTNTQLPLSSHTCFSSWDARNG